MSLLQCRAYGIENNPSRAAQIYAKVNDGLKYKEMMKLDGLGGE